MAYNLTSTYSAGRSGVLGTVLIVIFILTVVLNIFVLFVFFRVKRPIRRPPNYFLASLAFADLITAVLWVIPALVAAIVWEWEMGKHFCNFHAFVQMWGYCMNMHFFVTIMFEKFCKILFPSKHKDAFYNKKIVVIIILALLVFDTVISFLPHVGWGRIAFFSYQFQCVPDYEFNSSHLMFVFIVTYALPIVCVVILSLGIGWKIKSLQQKVGPSNNQKFVLEERKDVVKESFAERLKKQQASFQKAGMKKKKPKIGGKRQKGKKKDSHADDGYISESSLSASSHYESSTDDEDTYIRDYDDYKRMKKQQADAKKKKRVYTFRRSDMLLAVTVMLCCGVFSLLWLGYWTVSFLWVYDPQTMTDTAYIFFTLLTFGALCCKPLLYIANKQLRQAFVLAFKCKRKEEPPPAIPVQAPQPKTTTRVVERHITIEETFTTSKTTSRREERAAPEMVNFH
jgi:hypothetical protein